ncbi:MAG: toprim domain-containing protein [Methanomassiliicoccales archaeon]
MRGSTDVLEKVERVLRELAEENTRFPIIVEGKNDRDALRRLGIGGEVIVVNGHHTLFGMCEQVSRKYRKVIVLTDWDRKGGQICHQLLQGLHSNGVKVDDYTRTVLSALSYGVIKDVESLPVFVEKLRMRAHRS